MASQPDREARYQRCPRLSRSTSSRDGPALSAVFPAQPTSRGKGRAWLHLPQIDRCLPMSPISPPRQPRVTSRSHNCSRHWRGGSTASSVLQTIDVEVDCSTRSRAPYRPARRAAAWASLETTRRLALDRDRLLPEDPVSFICANACVMLNGDWWPGTGPSNNSTQRARATHSQAWHKAWSRTPPPLDRATGLAERMGSSVTVPDLQK